MEGGVWEGSGEGMGVAGGSGTYGCSLELRATSRGKKELRPVWYLIDVQHKTRG